MITAAPRERIYEQFRNGDLRCIVLSKVGNFAIDLPDADVLIQVSGGFGSRHEVSDGAAGNVFQASSVSDGASPHEAGSPLRPMKL